MFPGAWNMEYLLTVSIFCRIIKKKKKRKGKQAGYMKQNRLNIRTQLSGGLILFTVSTTRTFGDSHHVRDFTMWQKRCRQNQFSLGYHLERTWCQKGLLEINIYQKIGSVACSSNLWYSLYKDLVTATSSSHSASEGIQPLRVAAQLMGAASWCSMEGRTSAWPLVGAALLGTAAACSY